MPEKRARRWPAPQAATGEDISPLHRADGSRDSLAPCDALRNDAMIVVEISGTLCDPRCLGRPPHTAVVMQILAQGTSPRLLVAGISPRLNLDERYRDFFELLRTQLATAIANARAYEEEKKRAEALAEIDRAKTAFFSNISHEFRTPLTLMLGPVEDLLAKSRTDLPPAAASQLEVVSRNGLRLLRLVNTLLDFSRIEAGRVRPPTSRRT
jgi:K+-sensing histidine kinase KdpD